MKGKKKEERLILNLNSREIRQLAIAYINNAPLKKILPLAELQAKSRMGLIKEKAKKSAEANEPEEIPGSRPESAGTRHRWTPGEEKKLMEEFTPIKKDMQFKKEAKEKNKALAEEMGLPEKTIQAKYYQLMKGKEE